MVKTFIEFDSNTNPASDHYLKLNKKHQKILDEFEKYISINAGDGRANKAKTNAIRFLVMVKKDLDKVSLLDLREFLLSLKSTSFSDFSKNDIKNFVQRFLKWHFKDWSERFDEFKDIKIDSEPQRKRVINPEDVLTKEQVEDLIKSEPILYWKTFLMVQYEGALRTQETRTLKWDMIDKEDSEVYWLKIISKKNRMGKGKERISPPLVQSRYFLDELKKQFEKEKIKSDYVFPSKTDINKPISSGTANKWFSRLTKKVLGKNMTNYLLRHSKGENFHSLVRDNKLSEENATKMMGHSSKMFHKTYSHTNKKEFMDVIKKQLLNVDYIAPEKKSEYEERLNKQEKEIKEIQKQLALIIKGIKQ
jgi:integrase